MAALQHRIKVHASPEVVFAALTTADGLRSWYTSSVAGTVAEGEEFTLDVGGGETFRWRVTALEPGRSVRWECVDGPGDSGGTSVTYTLSGDGDDRTVVEFDHDGWADGHRHLRTCNTLWGVLLGHLKKHSETGAREPALT